MEEPPRVRNGEMIDNEEKVCLETDTCLDKKPPEEEKKKTKLKDKVKDKCACLALTWKGIIVLFVLIVILFLFFIAILVLAINLDCWGFSSKRICQRSECLRIGATVLEKMNFSADPCKDFFEYACGGWIEKNLHGERWASYGRYTALQDHVHHYHELIRRRLNTLPPTKNITSLQWKMKGFYDSCMNVEAIQSSNYEPLKRIIDNMYGWDVLTTWVKSQWEFDEAFRRLQETYGVYPFFKVTVKTNRYLPGKTVIAIEPSGLGMPNRHYYYRSREDKVVEGYLRLLKDIASLFHAGRPAINSFAEELFNFEKRLAEVYPEERFNKLQVQQKPITVKSLQLTASRIRWVEHLSTLFRGITINEGTQIMANLTYLKEVSRIISSSDNSVLNNYLMWTLVRHYAPYVSSDFRDSLNDYKNKLTGSYRPVHRWEFCIQETEKLFPIATIAMFAEHKIPKEAYSNVSLIFTEIVKSFGNRIYYYKWMDEKTRQIAMEKLKNIRYDAVVPPFLNSSFVSFHYIKLNIFKSDFFQNVLNGVQFRNTLKISWLKNASEFHQYKSLTSAELSPVVDSSRKTLLIPPVLLHRYFYDFFQPASFNFGALGTLISRALVYLIEDADDYDREWKYHLNIHRVYYEIQREKEVFIPQFWSNRTLEKYERYQNCVSTEYFKYSMPNVEINRFGHREDVHVNGNRTLRENFADIAAVIIAYQAFENWQWNHGKDKYLPGLQNRTQNQMFFISFAQSLCSVDRSASLIHQLDFSNFSPNKIRVNGALAHMQDFVWTYSCSSRSHMNAYYKCETW